MIDITLTYTLKFTEKFTGLEDAAAEKVMADDYVEYAAERLQEVQEAASVEIIRTTHEITEYDTQECEACKI